MTLMNTANQLSRDGFFGPITASLDWCEANYQFSYYIAEIANTFSNFFTLFLAIRCARNVSKESLPARYIVGCIGFALVGLGSFAFHASLLYEAQLADELPMIYVSSMSIWLLYDYQPGFNLSSNQTKLQIAALILFDILFTWSYVIYRNPVYHQIVFGSLVISCAIRIAYLLNWSPVRSRIPSDKKQVAASMFTTGALTFTAGFVIWNIDNICCDVLTSWKKAVGWPMAFLFEGHSWWHLLTGLGTYYMFLGIQCNTLCIKDDQRKFTLARQSWLPYIKRLDK
ncbi:alkaline phytoceramidase [Gymnopus androsaceus JB14]|uniref:Alkaline phytoceramidase n=1 Tax=Gymnopus androsaceus JB14 TaxID=1447944 RepID=A0A6A4HLC1_9AGAR|nr:alkaline phytoceramidase [Gymnopus androsaceus JB14]